MISPVSEGGLAHESIMSELEPYRNREVVPIIFQDAEDPSYQELSLEDSKE